MGNRIASGIIIAVLLAGGAYFANLSRESSRALRSLNETAESSVAALKQVRQEKQRLEDELKKRGAGIKKAGGCAGAASGGFGGL